MSGGRIVVRPPQNVGFDPAENVIAGNTLLYGATGGEAFLSGVVGERFAVRNSGAVGVVEGLGDHGCEYMTGGVIVVLGRTGRNFAAGMSGGVAFVYDPKNGFAQRINDDKNLLQERITEENDVTLLRSLIEKHQGYTASRRAAHMLANWETELPKFVKVISKEYKELTAHQAALVTSRSHQKN
jgi:glutamate synthase domain-containing protein 3